MEKLPGGLTSGEAADRLRQYGPNVLKEEKPKSLISLILSQIRNPLIVILLVASVITYLLGDVSDTVVILLAVVVNTTLGFIQEYKADQALYALKKLLEPKVKVIRDGIQKILSAKEVVVGDILLLGAGDRVPADGVVKSAVKLYVNESVLTGESVAVEKGTSDMGQETRDKGHGTRNDTSTLFMGTMVASGRATMCVTGTGMDTQIGRIAGALTTTTEEATPLQRSLSKLARFITFVVLGLSGIVFVLGIFAGEPVRDMYATAVAVAVAAIPEGMVVALTVVLAMGMQRIYKKHAIVRRLSAAETLGSVSTLCVDKTGTITQGVMSVVKTKFTDGALAYQAATLANNKEDPLEMALWDWLKIQSDAHTQQLTQKATRHDEIPFGGEHKYMAVLTDTGLWVKGAPDILLEQSNLTQKERQEWTRETEAYGREGLRVIALCYKYTSERKLTHKSITGLTFIGIIGISDPVREGVAEAIRTCQMAGIKVKMVTGDYRHTASAVAKSIGLDITNHAIHEMSGMELEKLTVGQLARRIEDIVLFYRVTPQQKYKIVEALQLNKHVVGMTGDGVNDALALKKADIGLVVGGASDVARETADIVLLDSNIRTIAAIIEEGRAMFQTIRKVVTYLLSSAFAEVVAIVGAIFIGVPLPVTAAQILWINLISDGLPSIALTLDPKGQHLMGERPRRYSDGLMSRPLLWFILCISILVGILTTLIFVSAYRVSGDLRYSRTMAFLVLGTCSLCIGFSVRNLHVPLWSEGLWKNPWLFGAIMIGMMLQGIVIYIPAAQKMFNTTAISMSEWGIAIGSGFLVVAIIELLKLIRIHRSR